MDLPEDIRQLRVVNFEKNMEHSAIAQNHQKVTNENLTQHFRSIQPVAEEFLQDLSVSIAITGSQSRDTLHEKSKKAQDQTAKRYI